MPVIKSKVNNRSEDFADNKAHMQSLVDDLRVEQSCGHRVLDRAASRTVRRWQFSPAKRAGLPVSSQARIPVRFRLEDG